MFLRQSLVLLAAGLVAAPAPSDKVDLRLRLKEGQTYKLTMTTAQQIDQEIQGTKQSVTQDFGFGLNYLVEKVDPASGAMRVKVTYEWTSATQMTPAGKTEFDSRTQKGPVPPAQRGFAALVGRGFGLTLNPFAGLSDVTGADAMVTAMVEQMDLPAGPERQAAEAAMRKQFNDESLKNTFDSMAIFPEHPVDVGESWKRQATMKAMFTAIMDNTYTLRAREGGKATIAVESTIRPPEHPEPTEMGGAKLTFSLSGTQQGEFVIDEGTGWYVSGRISQDLGGTMTIVPPGGTNGLDVPVKIATKITLTGTR